jgi:hypothetical protein
MSEDDADLDQAVYEDVPEDEGVLQPSETLDSDDLDADPLDTGISPRERHPASEGFGVTLAEARTGETLDQRLAQEEPESGAGWTGEPGQEEDGVLEDDEFPFGDSPQEPRAGRLLAADEGSHPTVDPSFFVRDVGIDGGAAGAEEAAMHVIDEDDELDDEDLDPEF